jgi:hypothetical protein
MDKVSMQKGVNILCLISILILINSSPMTAQSLDNAASSVFDYTVNNCKVVSPTEETFWKNPICGQVLLVGQNGWQAGPAIQSAILNFECTRERKYIKLVEEYGAWVLYQTRIRNNLTLCQTMWHDPAEISPICGADVSPSITFNDWCDDAGWNINIQLFLYKYIGNPGYRETAFNLLKNCDSRWGVDFQANSRALRYFDGLSKFNLHGIVPQIIGALSLYEIFTDIGRTADANTCLQLACKYYNFVENYLHSHGPNTKNITGETFTVRPADAFANGCSIKGNPGCWYVPTLTESPELGEGPKLGTTCPQMMMAAIYEMLSQFKAKGANLSLIPTQDFHQKALNAANVIIALYPNGYAENGQDGKGTVLINTFDPYQNGFSCYWWIKYIVPINSKYGDILVRTAKEIVTCRGTGDLSCPCWNSKNCPTSGTTCPGSNYMFTTDISNPNYEFVRHGNASAILAAGRVIQNKTKINGWNYWIVHRISPVISKRKKD